MTRLSAHDFQPEVLQLFDRYVHGDISRRGFLDQAARVAGSATAAAGLLAALSPQFAQAEQVSPRDPRLETSYLTIASPQGNGSIKGYLVKPAASSAKLPAILVVHENRGLNPHIEDIARRLALEGFLVFAPDALTTLGGYPGDEDKARELFAKLDQNKTLQDFVASTQALATFAQSNGKVGVVGFCYGGTVANALATRMPELLGAVPFYGGQPPAADVGRIKAALLIHYAGADDRVNAGWPAYEAALKAAGTSYEAYIYPGVQHGFNNDTTPRFDAQAAGLAWQRTVAFFKTRLGAAPAQTVRLRGVIQDMTATTLTVKTKEGESVVLQLPASTLVSEVFPVALSDVQTGSFIGTAAMPQPDGSLKAMAVTVFPESARGAGEGHRPFDLVPQSTMTNATVAEVQQSPIGRTLQVRYKGGDKTIVVPQDVPVVSFKPADASLLVVGASVSVGAQVLDNKPTAVRISAGRNGFVLPY
jgi:carboxymethylenebutenolidase